MKDQLMRKRKIRNIEADHHLHPLQVAVVAHHHLVHLLTHQLHLKMEECLDQEAEKDLDLINPLSFYLSY